MQVSVRKIVLKYTEHWDEINTIKIYVTIRLIQIILIVVIVLFDVSEVYSSLFPPISYVPVHMVYV